jgi:phospholipid-binding lipoprotein MlaA
VNPATRTGGTRLLRLVALTLLALWLGGCATWIRQPDPFEKANRQVFAFNETLDAHVIKPVAEAYQALTPRPVRVGLTNFFGNVRDLWSAVNLVLQGRVGEATSDMLRFSTNTTLGLFGFLDIASEMGLDRHGEDFGLTLGRWGFSPGPYIVWPLFGPSTVRDSVGLPVDLLAAPDPFITDIGQRNFLSVTRLVNTRANLLKATQVLDDIALDRYNFVRDAYLQRRRSLIMGGETVEEEPQERYDLPEGAAPPAVPASVPPPVQNHPPEPVPAPKQEGDQPAPAPVPAPQPASTPASGPAPGASPAPASMPASAAALGATASGPVAAHASAAAVPDIPADTTA